MNPGFAPLLVAAFTLASCSMSPRLYVINHTGQDVEVVWASNDGNDRTSELDRPIIGRFLIRDGEGRNVIYSRDHDLFVQFRMGDCIGKYRVPELTETLSNTFSVVRLERDRALYLIGHAVWPDEMGDVESREAPPQPAGYPIRGEQSCAR